MKYNLISVAPEAVMSRFWSKVRVDESGCLVWTGALNTGGYGNFRFGRSAVVSHRFLYVQLVGPIPVSLQLDHLCRNRQCVRVDHLEPVTAKENVRRGDQGAFNRNKTHCPRGHEYSEQNTYTYRGLRSCRSCSREKAAERKAVDRGHGN